MSDEAFGKLLLGGKPLFESDWLQAEDLQSRDWPMEVKSVERAEVFDPGTKRKKVKVAIMFTKGRKGLICNKTNATSIAKVTNQTEAQNWIGKTVVLYPTTCKVGRETSSCIRIRETSKGQPRTPPPDRNELPGQNDPYQGLQRRIHSRPNGSEASIIKVDISDTFERGEITREESDELHEMLRKEMA